MSAIGPLQPVIFTPIQAIHPVTPGVLDPAARQLPSTPQQAVPPATPQAQALSHAVAQAAGRQAGLAPLMADLGQALAAPALPAPVRAAAAQVLALQTPLSPALGAPELRQAVGQSGLFLEARLATQPHASPGPDLKAALLVLRQVLVATPHASPASTVTAPPREAPPPPYRGGPTRGQRPASPTLPAGAAPQAVAARLLQETDAALAREELMQAASLPEGPRAAEAEPEFGRLEPSRWMLDIPFSTPQGPAVAQMEISRDGRGPGGAEEAPVWRVRFSIDAEPLGPVHAAVTLQGDRAHVGLWAERPRSEADLRHRTGELAAVLGETATSVEVAVFGGAPPHRAPQAGRLVDQAT